MYSDSDGLKSLVAQFGDLRVEVCWRLTAAYRSLLRPSSATDAKASTVCPFLLEKNNSMKKFNQYVKEQKSVLVEATGVEPATACVQGRSSPN